MPQPKATSGIEPATICPERLSWLRLSGVRVHTTLVFTQDIYWRLLVSDRQTCFYAESNVSFNGGIHMSLLAQKFKPQLQEEFKHF